MKTLSLSLFCAIVVSSSALSAQTLYDWNQPDVPAVVTTSSKVIFIGKKKAPVRVYSFKGSKGANKTSVYLADLDRDGSPEVVGAGRPLFTLASNSDPIKFSKKGCAQALVADFTEDNKLDIACVDGRNLKVYTHDLQMKWESKVPMTLKWCRAGDVNGDLKADLECNVGGKKFLRFDGAGGEMLTPKATDTIEVQNPVNPTIADVGALDSKTMYDLDGDGTKKEALTKDGKSIFVGSKKVALDGEPLSALVKDLDGDKKLEVVVTTKSSVYVISGDAKTTSQFKYSKKYKRVPLAELKSVYANGFKDDKAAQKVVNDQNAKLSKCYSSQVKKNQFAGTGQMLIEVSVDAKGKVTNVQQHHSSLADKGVGTCAKGVLKKLKFPELAADAASVNVTMYFTFEDQ